VKRALHPNETRLLRHMLPALKRSLASRRRVAERASALKAATDLAEAPTEPFMLGAQRAFVLARSVQAEADGAFQEALLSYVAEFAPFGLAGVFRASLPACAHRASSKECVDAFCEFYGLPTGGDVTDESVMALLDLGLTVHDGGKGAS